MKLTRMFAALALPLMLSSCFLIPGAFTSSMDVRKDGTFTFAYKGEMIFQSPDEVMNEGKGGTKIWSEAKTKCSKDGEPFYDEYSDVTEAATPVAVATTAPNAADASDSSAAVDDNARPCTKAEIAKLKQEFDEASAAKANKDKEEASKFATVFGFNPGDDDANRKLAATMMKYDGWKSVSYRGKGVFDVDYVLTSKVGHDYVFPIIPQAGDFIIPFVSLRKRESGAVMVSAPALVGGGMRALGSRMQALGGAIGGKDMPGPSQATHGTFTLTTDAEILTNNTEDGPASDPKGKRLIWEISPGTDKIPEALVKLR